MNKYETECLVAASRFERKVNFKARVKDCQWDDDIIIELPEPPRDLTKIANYGKPKSERKFPVYDRDEINRIDNLDPSDPEKLAFIEKEWRIRYGGFFFFNGDNLEWIPGHYYMTLQYWEIPLNDDMGATGPPRFTDMHRDIMLAIWDGKRDKNCGGICFLGCRRSGKSMLGTAEGYWDTTEVENAVFGIQSKTFSDSKMLLQMVVRPWQRLMKIWKPTDTQESTVTTKLRFSNKKERGEDIEYGEVLNSSIEAFPSVETAMDGLKTRYQFQDEFGKRVKTDAYKTQQITKVCNLIASKIVGFAFWATTVEEMESGGGEAAYNIWENSSPKKKNRHGRTPTTLRQLFFPAFYGMFEGEDPDTGEKFMDEWGYSNQEAAIRWLDSEEEHLTGTDLLDFRRKFPRTVDDCFRTNMGMNSFASHRIIEQRIHNSSLVRNPAQRGDLVWKNGVRWGEVVWYPNEHSGRWTIAIHPPEEHRNKWEQRGNQKFPARQYFKTGCDPVDHSGVATGSMPIATTILQNPVYGTDYPAMSWAAVYHYRPEDTSEFYEDMIKQNVYYSSFFMAEANKYGVLTYMKEKGYDGYCLQDPLETDLRKLAKGQKGFHNTSNGANNDKRNELMTMVQSHIYDCIGRLNDGTFGFCPFDELLDDWLRFNPAKWTPHDYTVSSMMTLLACRQNKSITQQEPIDLRKLYKRPTIFSRGRFRK
jgi:hypothetical protein